MVGLSQLRRFWQVTPPSAPTHHHPSWNSFLIRWSAHSEVKLLSLSHVKFFATPWTVACQAPLSMIFFRQEYWSELPFPSPGDLPDAGIERTSPVSPALQADSLKNDDPLKGRSSKLFFPPLVLFLKCKLCRPIHSRNSNFLPLRACDILVSCVVFQSKESFAGHKARGGWMWHCRYCVWSPKALQLKTSSRNVWFELIPHSCI